MKILHYFLNNIQDWGYTHIGPLSEVSLKHRNYVLLISILLVLISPEVKITFGTASIAGMGIEIDPAQTIYIGVVLLFILLYRISAFWATALITHGSNEKSARRKAALKIDADSLVPPPPQHISDVVKEKAEAINYKWSFIRLIWEFFLPNILALAALSKYTYYYVTTS